MTFSSLIIYFKWKIKLKFTESIKKNSHFREIYQRGISYGNSYLVMYVLENGTSRNRIGISVSKKVGNSVIRHRVTRLIRESYRLNENLFKKGIDIVIVARVNIRGRSFAEVNSAVLHLGRLHHILDNGKDGC